MKKKLILFSSVALIVVVVAILIIVLNKKTYTIKVSLVDDHSPDRILTVYNTKNEKVEVQKIEYSDGTLLCNGYNTTVHFGDIENEKELIVILKEKSKVKAKIVEEEVK